MASVYIPITARRTPCMRVTRMFFARIVQGQAVTCLNNDKRPRAIGNIHTSISCTLGWYNEEYDKFDEGIQAGGLSIYSGHVLQDLFPTNKITLGSNPNQNLISLARREETFHTFLELFHQHNLKIEHWDVRFCQGSFKQLRINEQKLKICRSVGRLQPTRGQ